MKTFFQELMEACTALRNKRDRHMAYSIILQQQAAEARRTGIGQKPIEAPEVFDYSNEIEDICYLVQKYEREMARLESKKEKKP